MKGLFSKQSESIPIGEIKPQGWLKEQLEIQMSGLSGNLDLFWKDVAESAWIGGESEGWERFPYWLDGAIPLAWQLDDAELKQRINGYMDYIFSHQLENGWLGPLPEQDEQAHDIWSQFLAVKVLVVYYDATGDKRVEPAVRRALRNIESHIELKPVTHWAHSRWYEVLIGIWWLYDLCGEQWLLQLAAKLKAQGFDWNGFIQPGWPYGRPSRQGEWNYMNHVVNNTQCLKSSSLWYRFSGNEQDRNAWKQMQSVLDSAHGLPNGTISGDECLAGKSPLAGTELCSIVEHMYSLEVISDYSDDTEIGDRLEKLAYNALPATLTSDMWAHQYVQQINQVECSVKPDHLYTTNSDESNIYGLEPHFGCCTSNLHQGFPKFVASLWKRQGNCLLALAYGPNRLSTQIDGKPVVIETVTDYPFNDQIRFVIQAQQPVQLDLKLRIPGWCPQGDLKWQGGSLKGRDYLNFSQVVEDKLELVLTLPMHADIRTTQGYGLYVERGPLLYSYNIPSRFNQINREKEGREFPHCDYEVTATQPWNYALLEKTELKHISQPLNDGAAFSAGNRSNRIQVSAVKAENWQSQNGNANPLPIQVLTTEKPQTIELVPYGCTDLRIAEFPAYKADKQH